MFLHEEQSRGVVSLAVLEALSGCGPSHHMCNIDIITFIYYLYFYNLLITIPYNLLSFAFILFHYFTPKALVL